MSKGGIALPANGNIGWLGGSSTLLGTEAGVLDPANHATAATVLTDAAETALFVVPCRVIRVTADGNLIVTLWDDDTALTTVNKLTLAVTAGQELTRFLVRKVWATGTTAHFLALG